MDLSKPQTEALIQALSGEGIDPEIRQYLIKAARSYLWAKFKPLPKADQDLVEVALANGKVVQVPRGISGLPEYTHVAQKGYRPIVPKVTSTVIRDGDELANMLGL